MGTLRMVLLSPSLFYWRRNSLCRDEQAEATSQNCSESSGHIVFT